MSEEEIKNIIYLKNKPISSCKDLHKYFIGRHNEPIIVYLTPKFEIEFENNFYKLECLEQENKKYKEEKRLILKDIKEWIACAKNEELEGYKTHLEYWEMFETILRKIFTKYNTENISDDDLKYNHYLEKENENLILENKKYKKVINKAINKLGKYADEMVNNSNAYAICVDLLDILKEVKYEKSNN